MRFEVLAIALLAACDTSYDGTAFKCRDGDACPERQQCFGGRCRSAPAVSISCGATTCGPEQQCCADPVNGNRCIPAIDDCISVAALCDGRDDCASDEVCCFEAKLTRCFASCDSPNVCTTAADCPSDAPNCCPQDELPWSLCQLAPC